MLSVKALLTKLVDRLNPTKMFMITSLRSSRVNMAANTNTDVYINGSNPGYYPIGIVGWYYVWFAGQTALINSYLLTVDQRGSGTCRVHGSFRNMNASTTFWELEVSVLWVKI